MLQFELGYICQYSGRLWAGQSHVQVLAGAEISLFSKSPDCLWDPSNLLFNWCWGFFPGIMQPGHEGGWWPPSRADVKNEQSYTFSPLCQHDDMDKFTVVFICTIFCQVNIYNWNFPESYKYIPNVILSKFFQGHHPEGGAHAKFTNYSFHVDEFLRLVAIGAKHVKHHKAFLEFHSTHHDELQSIYTAERDLQQCLIYFTWW